MYAKNCLAIISFYGFFGHFIFAKSPDSYSHHFQSSASEINIVNSFGGCVIRVINFRGLDASFPALIQPIFLLRYFVIYNDWHLYPFEFHLGKTEHFNDWIWKMNFTGLRSKSRSSIIQGINIFYRKSESYMNLWSGDHFYMENKNAKCEVNIYLHPPNEKTDPLIFMETQTLGTIIHDPFWLAYALDTTEQHQWKNYYLSTMPKYSLLICNKTKDAICYNNIEKRKWISGVLHTPSLVRMSETFMILEIVSTNLNLHLLCIYCNPCKPITLVSLATNYIPNSIESMKQQIEQLGIQNSSPFYIDVELTMYLREYNDLKQKFRQTGKAVLEHLSIFNLSYAGIAPRLINIHTISQVIPANSTLRFHSNRIPNKWEWKHVKIESCSSSKPINYHSKLRPVLIGDTQTYLSFYKEIGLVFYQEQLKFVSCHEERPHWFYQLKELFVVFDIPTWSLLITLLFIATRIIKYIPKSIIEKKKNTGTYFDLFAAMLDQSSKIFDNVYQRRNSAFLLSFSFIPTAFLILGNQYKGDNITRLTLDASLIPFDTFDSLVENRFEIFLRPVHMQFDYRDWETADPKKYYVQESDHEAYPIVSQLWYFVSSHFKLEKSFKISSLENAIPERILYYLENSKMLSVNISNGHYQGDVDQNRLEKYIEKCDKAALILLQEAASYIYDKLSVNKKPAYLGKDIIIENWQGFNYFGYFPVKILLRFRHYFQSGIVGWWGKHVKWVLMMRTRAEEMRTLSELSIEEHISLNGMHGQIYALCFVPLVGFLISTVAFILVDSHILKNIVKSIKKLLPFSNYFKTVVTTFKNLSKLWAFGTGRNIVIVKSNND